MVGKDRFRDQIEGHLQQALEAEDTKQKDYHIRSALQVCYIDGETEDGEFPNLQ